ALAQKAEELARLRAEKQSLSAEKESLARVHEQTAQELQRKSALLIQILNSHGWKTLSVYYRLRDKLLPGGTWRRGVTKKTPQRNWVSLAAILQLPRYVWEGIRLLREMRLLAASGLFDSDWYLQQNPDVARAGVNPLLHYLRGGARDRRDPNRYFDSDWYLRQNPDVARVGVNPLLHYLRRGAKEGRRPSPNFDGDWYLQQNPDVAWAGVNPLAHYLQQGAKEGRSPSLNFDADPHLQQNPNVAEAGANRQAHHPRPSATQDAGEAQRDGNVPTTAISSSVRTARFLKISEEKKAFHIGIGLVEHFGDIVACEPVVRYLKKQSPDVEISWVVREPYRELLDSNPYIDRTIAVECLTDWIKLVAHGAFDRVVDLHVNDRICQQCRLPLSKTSGDVSVTGDTYFNYGSLLRSFCLGAGLPPLEEQPRVYVSEEVVKAVDRLELPDTFVVIHCRSNETYKDWDAGKWNALAEHVVKAFRTPVVEVGLEPILASHIPSYINLCGKTSLLETAEIIKRAALFVGVDSGPAHLANAVNTYGIVVMGQIGPFKTYNPFTGGYADGSNAVLIRNENGPATDIPLDIVKQAVARKFDSDQKHGGPTAAADRISSGVEVASRESPDVLSSSGANGEELPRLIAFYLPQYYPIPENDANWGKGFTEWRNVGKARPFFEGQYQPRLPGELGYYDLRVPEIMERQAALAQEHGIHGFCYYLYWFQGKRLLHLPVDTMLRRRKPNRPFCFCWANENWTRRWDGLEREILVAQEHTHEDDIRFIRHFLPTFDDPRYIRVNGRPLLLIYRTELFPNPRRTVETWRNELRKAGLGEPYLVRCEGFDPWTKPEDIGFDAAYEVPSFILPEELFYDKIKELKVSPEFTGRIYDYERIVRYYSEREDVPYKRFKGIMLAWDNTPRHGKNAVVFHNVTPEKYSEWVQNALGYTLRKFRGEERLVFINAWNEWAEGNYLEPDLRYGTSFLQATKTAYTFLNRPDDFSRRVPALSVESREGRLRDKRTPDVA
ncbi:MAG: glycoside hydrolase family 99-like domain-containing protein, partial [Acidobacteria bacterium]|nr:glycoside hydrolase family 99-like domain-containing protein [Acidobacteriota bacterium]